MTTDGDHAMIIGTIVTRFLADGTIIPGDGCDTAPASVAIELSRKVGAGACVEFAAADGSSTYYHRGQAITPPWLALWRKDAIASMSAAFSAGGATISVARDSQKPRHAVVTIDGAAKSYSLADIHAGTLHSDPTVRDAWREIERRAAVLVAP